MKHLNLTFTEEEYTKMMRVKRILPSSWHDLLLRIFEEAETGVKKQLKEINKSDEEIERILKDGL